MCSQQEADGGDDERPEDEQQKAEDGAGEKDDEDGELAGAGALSVV